MIMHPKIEIIKSIPCIIINLSVSNYTLNKDLLNHIKAAVALSESAKIIIIRGSRELFCKGMDLEEIVNSNFTSQDIMEKLQIFRETMALLTSCSIPIISLVEGNVYGGGLSIVCAADVVIMGKHVEISLPETIMGIIPAMIFPYITKRLSFAKAKALTLGARPLNSSESFALGLADEIAEDTEALLIKFIKRLSHVDATACKEFKKLFQKYYGVNDADYYQEAMQILTKLITSDDMKNRLTGLIGGDIT